MDQTGDKAQEESEALRAQIDEQKFADEQRDRDEARAREDRDRAEARAREDRELADRRWREDDDRQRERDAQDAERAERAKRPRAETESPSIAQRIWATVAGEKKPIAAKPSARIENADVAETPDPLIEARKLESDTDAHDARLITGGFGRGIGREGYLLLEPGESRGSRGSEPSETELLDDEARQEDIKKYAYRFDGETPAIVKPVDGEKFSIPAAAKRVLVCDEAHAVWRDNNGDLKSARESEVERAAKSLHDAIQQAAALEKNSSASASMRMTHHE